MRNTNELRWEHHKEIQSDTKVVNRTTRSEKNVGTKERNGTMKMSIIPRLERILI